MPKATFFNLPEQKREHITACAVEEFYRYGYGQSSISRLVAAAGIAKGSFYQYFEDKADLYAYLISRLIADRKIEMAKEYFSERDIGNKSLFDVIRALFLAQIDEFLYNPQLMKIAHDFPRDPSSEAAKRVYAKYEGGRAGFFGDILRRARDRGELDPDVDLTALNFLLSGMSQQTAWHMNTHGVGALTREYLMGMLDEFEYILTNGIFAKTVEVAGDGAKNQDP